MCEQEKRFVENMMKKPLARVLLPCEEGGYFCEIKELKGCYSQGETIEEAAINIEEAARCWLSSLYCQGKQDLLAICKDA